MDYIRSADGVVMTEVAPHWHVSAAYIQAYGRPAVSVTKARVEKCPKLSQTDKALAKAGRTDLMSDRLVKTEQQVSHELVNLRLKIVSGGAMSRDTVEEGMETLRGSRWSSTLQRQVTTIQTHVSVGEGKLPDLRSEYAARRVERELTARLAAVEAMWVERGNVLRSMKRGAR